MNTHASLRGLPAEFNTSMSASRLAVVLCLRRAVLSELSSGRPSFWTTALFSQSAMHGDN